MSETMKAIRRAGSRRDKADRAKREATAELRELVRQAQAEGEPITRIASESGMSRQGIYDLIDQSAGR
jgi:DNA invertase Pin-like site-specific DNA recombinase